MSNAEEQKSIEREISRAREGVSERIDELDRRLRSTLDVKAFASEHANEIIAGGAVVGFLAGFGLPKMLRRVVQIGIPLAFIGWKVKQKMSADGNGEIPAQWP